MTTKQSVKPYVTDTAGCDGCSHRDASGIFELCKHAKSTYRYDGRADFHTVQHMREHHGGLCGANRALFSK